MLRFINNYLVAIVFLSVVFYCSALPAQTDSRKIDSLKEVLAIVKSDTNKVLVLKALSASYDCSDTMNKLMYANKALQTSINSKWENGMISSYLVLGKIYDDCNRNILNAIKCHEAAAALAKSSGDKFDQATALEYLADDYFALAQYSKALDYYRQVLANNPGRPAILMGTLGEMGVLYTKLGDYPRALSCYDSSLKVLEIFVDSSKTSDINTLQMGGLLITIGDIYLAMAQYDKALENYNNAEAIGLKTKHKKLVLMALKSLGNTYQSNKDYAKAIRYYTNAIEESRQLNDKYYEANILDKLSNVYLSLGDAAKATVLSQSALQLAEKNTYNDQLPVTYTTLGKVFTSQKSYTQAVAYLQKAIALCEKTGALADETGAWESLSATYKKMTEPAKALDAYEHYITDRDSLYNIGKANELTRIDLQASYNRQQMADNLENEVKMQQQRVLTYSGYIGLGLVLLLAFFIYRNYNTQKKYNRLLSKEKARHIAHMKAQDNVLSAIADIQAHKVRGPLATMMGLVQLFNHDDFADPINKEVVDGLDIVSKRLDTIVKEVIYKENKLRSQKNDDPYISAITNDKDAPDN